MKKTAVVMFLLITILLSGCISDESPSTDTTIILNEKTPTVVVTASTDRTKAVWSIDGVEIETVDNIGNLNFVLYYRAFTTGDHTLRLEDADEFSEWKVSVFHETTVSSGAVVNDSRGYDRNASWAERHRIAREKMNATKPTT